MKTVFGIAAIMAILVVSNAAPCADLTDSSEYVIVANKQLQGTSINMAALKGIYLREVRNLANSQEAIIPVDLSTANGFYQNLFGKSYVQMQAYWLNMRIKHSVDLPVSKKDAESVKQFIAANKAAIGFLRNSDLDDRVKVLKVTE
jgi:phosphatidate phosphatase APP1